jgi:hypothetical protein
MAPSSGSPYTQSCKNRGIKDIFIACVDGLTASPKPPGVSRLETSVQLCMVHKTASANWYRRTIHARSRHRECERSEYPSTSYSVSLIISFVMSGNTKCVARHRASVDFPVAGRPETMMSAGIDTDESVNFTYLLYKESRRHPSLLLQRMIIHHARQVCMSASLVRYWARSHSNTSASSSCSALRLRSRVGSSGISVSFQTRKK